MVEISDSKFNYNNIIYISNQIGSIISRLDGTTKTKLDIRSHLFIDCGAAAWSFIKPVLTDKIADVIAVNYKYNYLKKNIRIAALSPDEYEFMLCALIAADIVDDKRYIKAVLKNNENYFIDGDFNFKMQPLKQKWGEIVRCVPPAFDSPALKEFAAFLISEHPKGKVYVDNHDVYDRHFNKLQRTFLINDGQNDSVVKEVLLSACSSVELCKRASEKEEYYLKQFFGDKIFFSSGYFS